MNTKFFRFLDKYNAFGIADEEVKDLCYLSLGSEEYTHLGSTVPDETQPLIAFLAGREEGHYTIDFPYAYALRNAKIRFLDYDHFAEQMEGCQGLVLPGGAFASPKEYYAEGINKSLLPEPGKRSYAYVGCLQKALSLGIPVLGICAGMQIIAGEFGGSLFPDARYLNSAIEHKTKDMQAHKVFINPGSFLHDLLGVTELMTNSRHRETVTSVPLISGVEVYARTADNVIEAIGIEKYKVLGVQWHPEDYVVAKDAKHERIYQWLIDEAKKIKFQ